ncbi:MAG: hypothetical protein CVU06_14830 [Bacteroidetes bacterium HGW-Bacteroidetes-22]|nr:MAG: hypothetical protein CVU06_14830 [Bacteroidetes bacterium HGW-Bacteroidetes-22]
MLCEMLYVGLLPVLTFLILYLYFHYRYPKGNLSPFLCSFIYGAIISIFIVALQMVVEAMGYAELKNLRRTAFHAFVVTGFAHQLGVFVVMMVFFYVKKYMRNPADGIVYATGTSLGVAMVTGLHFASFYSGQNFYHTLIYSYPPAMVITAVPIGFFAGLAVMRNNTLVDLMTGLLASSFFLGLYVFCLYTHEFLLSVLSGAGLVAIAFLFAYKAVNTKWDTRRM